MPPRREFRQGGCHYMERIVTDAPENRRVCDVFCSPSGAVQGFVRRRAVSANRRDGR